MVGPAELNARLAAVIRQRRVLLGMTQTALAERVGISFQQIQKYEKGKNQVGFVLLVGLAKAFGSTANELVAAALGEESVSTVGISDRETLELMKRLASLTPNQRRGVKLLVHNLAGEVA